MTYLPGLFLALTAIWFALSGQTEPLFLFLAVVSILSSVWLAARLEVIDRDASPYHRLPQFVLYGVWLIGEIIVSNVRVLKAIINPRDGVSPAVVRLKTKCSSDLSRTTFANSITLTPGTVTVDVDNGVFVVHALSQDGADPAGFEEMERRSCYAADPNPPHFHPPGADKTVAQTKESEASERKG
ncbi:MAG: Na+/H+ antiporter subunit E [Hyphomonadaceae bacterium]